MKTQPLTSLDAIVASQHPRVSPAATLPATVFPLETLTRDTIAAAQSKHPQLSDAFIDATYTDEATGLPLPRFATLSLFGGPGISVHARSRFHSYGGSITNEATLSSSGLVSRLNRGLQKAAATFCEKAQASHPWRWGLVRFFQSGWTEECWLTYRFTGLLPERTRQIATEAMAEFDKNLFLVCDAQGAWVKTEKAPSDISFPKRDPLLIGVKVIESQLKISLLDQFDVTLAEDYLTKEFGV